MCRSDSIKFSAGLLARRIGALPIKLRHSKHPALAKPLFRENAIGIRNPATIKNRKRLRFAGMRRALLTIDLLKKNRSAAAKRASVGPDPTEGDWEDC
jgi:hypothetical protein